MLPTLPLAQSGTRLIAGHTGRWRRGGVCTQGREVGGGPGTTRGLLCSSLGRFGSGAPLSSPALCSGDTRLAFLRPQLPHLWRGTCSSGL